ncbi:MAG: FadR/GntR family transcriptional regulator [Thermodesulfobacteriota bacterium]
MTSIKRKKLGESVIEEMQRMIRRGELKSGDKLPNQNEFAAKLGISRPTLREALHTLTLLGVIEQRPGAGTVIRGLGSLNMAEHLPPPFANDTQATLELVEARRFIEVVVVELAARQGTESEIAQIGRLVQDMTGALGQGDTARYAELDLAFHYQIAAAAHNRFLIHLFVHVRGLMEQFMREGFRVMPGMRERSLKFHASIYHHLKDRQGKKAARQMARHIQDIERSIKNYLDLAERKRPA